ncbi:MAG: hypothetical protein P9X22_09740 [Candidatus Zapsychrus exili]|nr:hypothetical protein [Candidatus Zapsychrus exili]
MANVLGITTNKCEAFLSNVEDQDNKNQIQKRFRYSRDRFHKKMARG